MSLEPQLKRFKYMMLSLRCQALGGIGLENWPVPFPTDSAENRPIPDAVGGFVLTLVIIHCGWLQCVDCGMLHSVNVFPVTIKQPDYVVTLRISYLNVLSSGYFTVLAYYFNCHASCVVVLWEVKRIG
jgi:hypothetical protein